MTQTRARYLVRFILSLTISIPISVQLSGCATEKKADSASSPAQTMIVSDPEAKNSAESLKKPYVVMVSIDGYRYDYNRLFKPPHLSALEREGVSAESLRPVYPSKTFPNHYALATGIYADRHGIVSNDFYDPERDADYSIPNRKAVEDGSWYSGLPLWLAARQQGMVSASFFWVGSEANIQGQHPNYFYRYDESIPNERRVDQVLEWLKMPEEKRPHMITMYFSDVDSAGHKHGPQAEQTREAVLAIDTQIGRLREGLASLNLPVHLIVVSDHGMRELEAKKVILLDEEPEIAELMSKFKVYGRGPQMQLYLNKGEDKKVISILERSLEKNAKHFRVRRKSELKSLNYSRLARVGDLVIEPNPGFLVGTKAKPPWDKGGNHGWDAARDKEMHGIFLAEGPRFKQKAKLKSFENVNVYPLVMEILNLKVSTPIDGKLSVTKSALKR